MNKYIRLISFLILAVLAMTISACKPKFAIGTEQTFAIDVPRSETGNAVNVTLDMAVPQGALALAGEAEGLIEGKITYNAMEYEPVMTNNDGALLIRQAEPGPKSVVVSVQKNLVNQWDLSLGGAPMNLEIKFVNGEYTIEFAESIPIDFNATVNAGVGKVKLILDPDLVAKIKIGEHTDLLEITTRGDWIQSGDAYQAGAGSAALTIIVNMRGGELNLDNK
jgi:uncharacterized protein DUF2154